ncbi:MAG: sigma-54-dependent Fis family transcriptional regulator [Myxococcales bacterium]
MASAAVERIRESEHHAEARPEWPVATEQGQVLVVDDERTLQRALSAILKKQGYSVFTASNAAEALAVLEETPIDVVLSDIQMPGLSGLDLLGRIKQQWPETEVVMMTAYGTVERAVTAVKAGAHDFLTKPFDNIDKVSIVVAKAIERKRLVDRNRTLESQVGARESFEDIVGQSEPMQRVFAMVDSVSYSTANVLIRGESGTGKELVARALHFRSPRKDRPFVVINCSALTETLLESELFGHVKGAFTGATGNKKGLFEAAHTGTIFLDEIGDVPPLTQVKLLRVLQEGEVKRVGSNEVIKVDVRVITATNADLEKAMREGRFREDLYYRLNVIGITLPSLRERVEDIPLLAFHFLRKYNQRMGKQIRTFADEVMEIFQSYRWVGNVRELENCVERCVVLSRGDTIAASALPDNLRSTSYARNGDAAISPDLDFVAAKNLAVQSFEMRYLKGLMARTGGNVSEASRIAGMDRSNFRRILKKYDIREA